MRFDNKVATVNYGEEKKELNPVSPLTTQPQTSHHTQVIGVYIDVICLSIQSTQSLYHPRWLLRMYIYHILVLVLFVIDVLVL